MSFDQRPRPTRTSPRTAQHPTSIAPSVAHANPGEAFGRKPRLPQIALIVFAAVSAGLLAGAMLAVGLAR